MLMKVANYTSPCHVCYNWYNQNYSDDFWRGANMKIYKVFIVPGVLFLLFLIFTVVLTRVDVQPIGPEQSQIGLATINQFVFEQFGVHLGWYRITNWLGVVAILVAFGFGTLGITQVVERKGLTKVDTDIILLGLCYVIVIVVYLFFEIFIVNYRPIILQNSLEASFPSSHTMVVSCVMTTAMVQFKKRIKSCLSRVIVQSISVLIIGTTIVGRLISGVHWFTDIIGGVLFSLFLIMFYMSSIKWIDKSKAPKDEEAKMNLVD